MSQTLLKDYQFSNLYLSESVDLSYLVGSDKAMHRETSLSGEAQGQTREIFSLCRSRYDKLSRAKPDFGLVFDKMPFRVAALQTQNGDMFMLRRLDEKIHTLSELKFPDIYIPNLTAPRMQGLILVAGSMNDGKSTTIAAIIHELLTLHGGVAVTIEDPIETPLEGRHGHGVCYQTEIEMGGTFAPAVRSVMRSAADIIMIGEIRDDDTAIETLAAGVNGHTVIASIHAENIPKTVVRMKALVARRYPDTSADALLSSGLYAIVHQRLNRQPNAPLRLEAEALIIAKSVSAQALIRRGSHEMLVSEIQQQQAALVMEAAHRRQTLSARQPQAAVNG